MFGEITDRFGRTLGYFMPWRGGCGFLLLLLLFLLCGGIYSAFAVLCFLPILLPLLAMSFHKKGRDAEAAMCWVATVVVDAGLFSYFNHLGLGDASLLAAILITLSSALPALGLYFHRKEKSTAALLCWGLTPVVYIWLFALPESWVGL